jgi:hypothetical protein
MNERIKQLTDEAGLYIAYGNRAVTDKEIEFFAELIIRECGRLADSAPQPVVRFAPYLLEQFGVER